MEFRVLGPVEMGPAAAPVPLRGHRRRGVLAVLLLRANAVVSTGELVRTLWAEPTVAAESNVRTQMTALRRLLDKHDDEPGRLVTEASGYRLVVRAGELDLAVFEELAAEGERLLRAGGADRAAQVLDRARRLWRGPALDGVSDSTALAAEADRLEERRMVVAELWADAAIAAGQAGAAVAELRGLVAANPVRERSAGLLMAALVESGEPAGALTVYQQLRTELVERLGTDPSPDLQRRYERILRGEPVRESAPGPAVVPRQLPAAPSGFTGRDAELAALTGLLDDRAAVGAVVISAIGGMAGVGKTSLALRWAHRVADRFPDGQLCVNLRGFAPSGAAPVTPAEALRRFLDAFDVPAERIPSSLDAQAALYRSLTAGKRLLILLDNARDEQQVRALLPGSAGCLVLVTSRHRLTGLITTDGAAPLALDLLTDAEARELLARRLGTDRVRREPAAVADIIELCARLPLALAVAAASAAERPNLDLAVLAAQLRDSRDRLDVLDSGDEATNPRAVFSWSYDALTPDAARLFRLLGLHPGPDISAPAAASLAALPLTDVQRALRELVRANLLTEHRGRYGLHDLLRAYATEQTHAIDSDADRRAATRRILDHYLHTAYAANRLISPGRDPITLGTAEPGTQPETLTAATEAMAWSTQEHAVVLATLDRAAATGAHTHTWQLAWTLTDFLDWRGHWDDWVATQQAAVTAAHQLADEGTEAHMRTSLASAYTRLGRVDEARAHLRRAVELAARAGDRNEQALAQFGLARVAPEGHPELAVEHAQRALDLFRETGNRGGEAHALNLVGYLYGGCGDYRRTLAYCEQSLDLQRELGDLDGQANAWDSLGEAHFRLGHHERALACYQQAADLCRELDNRYIVGVILIKIGEIHQAISDVRAARDSWRQALAILSELGHSDADAVRTKLAGLDDGG